MLTNQLAKLGIFFWSNKRRHIDRVKQIGHVSLNPGCDILFEGHSWGWLELKLREGFINILLVEFILLFVRQCWRSRDKKKQTENDIWRCDPPIAPLSFQRTCRPY